MRVFFEEEGSAETMTTTKIADARQTERQGPVFSRREGTACSKRINTRRVGQEKGQ